MNWIYELIADHNYFLTDILSFYGEQIHFFNDRLYVPDAHWRVAVRITPSLPGCVEMIRPSSQYIGGRLSSLMTTRVPLQRRPLGILLGASDESKRRKSVRSEFLIHLLQLVSLWFYLLFEIILKRCSLPPFQLKSLLKWVSIIKLSTESLRAVKYVYRKTNLTSV